MAIVINLRDWLFSDQQEKKTTAETKNVEISEVETASNDLVQDYTAPDDYVREANESAGQAFASEPGFNPDEPGTSVGQPVFQSEHTGVTDSEDRTEAQVMGVSLISKEATILGDIITEGHIDIVGKVRGNVEAEGNVAVRGLVSGDVTGEKIGLYQSRVKGNLNAGTGVVIDSDSVIIGDIDTDNVVLGGKLKGDIKAVKMAVLRSDAYFLGDVETESLAVESGAVVNGNIRTLIQGDLEAPFDED